MKHFIHHFTSILHGLIRTHKWPAPNVSGFIAQLVRASHRHSEVTGSNPVQVLTFSGLYTQSLKLRSYNCIAYLITATMVISLETAVVSPRLKKPDADYNQFSNFRSVSNLCLISKIIEKAVAVQLTNHIVIYHMDEMFQSAYKVFHSTETALLKVHYVLLTTMIL